MPGDRPATSNAPSCWQKGALLGTVDFREATGCLKDAPRDRNLAEALGVTVQSIRQARLSPDKRGHRPPPNHWRKVIAELARQRAEELRSLADRLEASDANDGA